MIAIVTNIDNDHLGTHDGDFERLKQSFVEFLHNLPFYGLAVLCVDDAHVRSILAEGESPGGRLRLLRRRRPARREPAPRRAADALRRGARAPTACASPVTVNLPGMHNVLNSLAAIAVALEIGIAHEAIQRALAQLPGHRPPAARTSPTSTTADGRRRRHHRR